MPSTASLEEFLPAEAREALRGLVEEVTRGGEGALRTHFPALRRLFGAAPAVEETRLVEMDFGEELPARCDLKAWRRCDVAGHALLRAVDCDPFDLFSHGDLDERTAILRSLSLSPIGAATARILWEVQRTNVEAHFRAAVLDSNLPARAWTHPEFGREGFGRMVLKAAFLGLDPERMFDVERRADAELARMLVGLATEREAAGRSVWVGTWWLIGHAPCPGARARLVGGIEHGDDRVRRMAARGLSALGDSSLLPFVRERLERERDEEVRAALERTLAEGDA